MNLNGTDTDIINAAARFSAAVKQFESSGKPTTEPDDPKATAPRLIDKVVV